VVIVRRPPDRIGGDLVTNAGGARRVVANHAAVLTKIEAACGTEASVASVCMEELDIFAQYRVFRGARVVVAQHGAALSNIVFCRPGALVVEITPELGNNAWHKNLADFCDVNYVGVPQLAITMRDWRAMHIEVASDVDVSHVFAHMNDAEMYYHPLAAFFRNSGRTSAAAVAKAVKAGLGLGSGSRRSAEINWI
jgi:hypothetical protein